MLGDQRETDTDLDPFLAEQSWREALDIATRLGDSAWTNRAEGELGLVAFLQGDISTSVIKLGRALQTAQSNGDLASVVRWLTLLVKATANSDARSRHS